MPLQVVPAEQYAEELAQLHFELEPGISRIIRLVGSNESDPHEPLKLLEVNADTFALGIRPIGFPAHIDDNAWYPPVVIIEVTPGEFEQIKVNPESIPSNWKMDKEYRRA